MDFLELTKKRYSVRSYTSQEVEKEKLDYILECARYAPVSYTHLDVYKRQSFLSPYRNLGEMISYI